MLRFAKGVLILILLTACQPPVEPDLWEFPDPSGPIVTSPVLPHTVWQNPLTIFNPTTTIDSKRSVYGIQVSGFRDEQVGQLINQAIQTQIDAYLGMTTPQNLPPLRGLYQRVSTEAKLDEQQVYAYVTYSLNGVLSVIVSSQFGFKNPDGTMAYFYLSEGLTFDCISGKRLMLSDLMVNDIDITQRINLAVAGLLDSMDVTEPSPQIEWFYNAAPLIQPFRGLRPSQNFALTGEGILLILDHRTPEFDVMTSTLTITLPYALLMPDLALTVRYADPSQFIEPVTGWQLFQTQDTRTKAEVFDLRIHDKTIPLRSIHPLVMNDQLRQRYEEQKLRLIERLSEIEISSENTYIEGGVFAMHTGPYTCIQVSYYVYQDEESLSDSWSICYDEYGVLLTQQALFTTDFDGEAYLRQLITDELIRSGYYRPGFDIDEAMTHLRIGIQLEGLSISTFAHAPGYSDPEYMYLFINYGTIGAKHLSILHPTP